MLKRMTGATLSHHSSLQKVELSQEARRNATKYYQDKEKIKELPEVEAEENISANSKKFVRFQAELEAGKIQNIKNTPKQPGKIPKLPVPKSWWDKKED